MAFVSDRKMGSGPLYTFTQADPDVYFTAEAIYYQTAHNLAAIQMGIADATLVIAGSVGSVGRGVDVTPAGNASITVTDSGAIRAQEVAISVGGGVTSIAITNDGRIEGATAIQIAGTGELTLLNTGVIASTFSYALLLGDGDDRITNSGTISGAISLGGGADVIDTRYGTVSGTISGGQGGDTYYIRGTEDLAEFSAATDIDSVYSMGDYTLRYGFENLYLIGGARTGVGNSADNTITVDASGATLIGAGGDDTLIVNGGDAVLRGGGGGDTLFGGAGDDVQNGGAGDDSLYDVGGANVLNGGAGDDRVDAGVDDDVIDGGAGSDLVVYTSATAGVIVNLTTGTAAGEGVGTDTLKSIERVQGSFYSDVLTGNGANNTLFGEDGDDQLKGQNGDDILSGGTGADQLDGGMGIDTVSYADEVFGGARVNLATGVNAGSATGDVLSSIENLTGTDSNDIFVGDDVTNRLDGYLGNDQLSGGAGEDVLIGDAGNDQLTGGVDKDIFLFADSRLAQPLGTDTIQDFQDTIDRISFVGNAAVDAFSDLSFFQQGTTARVAFDGGVIRLLNTDVSQLTAADFLFG